MITKSNKRENKTRIPYTYSVGDKIMLEKPGKIPKTLNLRTGPHTETKVYSNRTTEIQLSRFASAETNATSPLPQRSLVR